MKSQQGHKKGVNITSHNENANSNRKWDTTSCLLERPSSKRPEMNAGLDVERRESLYTTREIGNWCDHWGKQFGGFSKNEKENCHMIQEFQFWEYIQRKQNTNLKWTPPPAPTHTQVHSSIILMSKTGEQRKCLSVGEWMKLSPSPPHSCSQEHEYNIK